MMKHNFCFDTEYQIFKNGKLKEKIDQVSTPQIEGEVQITHHKGNGDRVVFPAIPMRSLVSGFIQQHFGSGNRLDRIIRLTQTNTAVAITNSALLSYNTADNASGSLLIQQMPTYNNGAVEIILSATCVNGSTQRNYYDLQTGIFINGGTWQLCTRDLIGTLTLAANESAAVTLTFRFPVSSERAMLNNFFLNFIQLWSASPFTTYKNTLGDEVTSIMGTNNTGGLTGSAGIYDATLNTTSRGIVVGSSNQAVDWANDYDLKAKIAGGSNEGELVAVATTSANFRSAAASYGTMDATFGIIEHWRDFQNASPSDITVREAGVIAYASSALFPSPYNYMISRWLTGDILVKRNETLRVIWKPKITV